MSSVLRLTAFKPANFGYVDGKQIAEIIAKWACNARKVSPLTEKSVQLYCDPKITTLDDLRKIGDADKILTELLRWETPIINAIVFIVHMSNNNFEKYFSLGSGKVEKGFEVLLEANNQVMLFVLIVLTRGSVPKRNALTAPIPRLMKDMPGLKDISNEGAFTDKISSFDLAQLDFSFLLEMDFPGMDNIFLNRLNLAMAGHKPLKIANDLMVYFVGSTDETAIPIQLANLLANKHKDNFWYPQLHPLNSQRITDKYKGFYRSCLFAIWVALGKTDDAYLRLKSHPALKPDIWVQGNNLKVHNPIYHKWDLDALDKDLSDERQFTSLKATGTSGEGPSEEIESEEEKAVRAKEEEAALARHKREVKMKSPVKTPESK